MSILYPYYCCLHVYICIYIYMYIYIYTYIYIYIYILVQKLPSFSPNFSTSSSELILMGWCEHSRKGTYRDKS